MCFQGQLACTLDVVVAIAWALMNRDAVASEKLLQRQVSLFWRRYAEWEAYVARSGLLLPKLFGRGLLKT
jgi:hypothetical protein